MVLILFFSNSGDAFADRGKAHIKIGSIKGGASNITYWCKVQLRHSAIEVHLIMHFIGGQEHHQA